MATSISATEAADETTINARDIGVTFYDHTNWSGFSYTIPSVNQCWRLPGPLFQSASSVRFNTNDVSCALYPNGFCLHPVLYRGLRESISDLSEIGLNDEVGSVYCLQIEQ
ncbi:hypothetical protein O988_04209 [Pseudogymnoascus sp. VKM F-3808]|nr:hypothetical protein O988_04209 [Pseudogymnoascus sp. VKM F-3808]